MACYIMDVHQGQSDASGFLSLEAAGSQYLDILDMDIQN